MHPAELSYSEFVKVLCKSGEEIELSLNADKAHLAHMAMGISGEAGELLDAIKKHVIYEKPLDFNNVVEELGDLEFYMQGLRTALGISRAEVLRANRRKLMKRYTAMFYTNEAAQARADKE